MKISLNLVAFAILMSLAAVAPAAIIAEVSGSMFFATGLGAGNGQQGAASGFSTSTNLTDVTISAPISVMTQTTTINAYLTNQIGPGTTQANVKAQTTVAVPVNTTATNNRQYTTVNFFALPDLAAGNWYLVLAEYDGANNAGVGYTLTGFNTFTFAPTAGYLGSFTTAQQSGTFAPGYSYQNSEQATLFPGDNAFTVTGTVVPEPAIGGAVLLIGFIAVARRHLARRLVTRRHVVS